MIGILRRSARIEGVFVILLAAWRRGSLLAWMRICSIADLECKEHVLRTFAQSRTLNVRVPSSARAVGRPSHHAVVTAIVRASSAARGRGAAAASSPPPPSPPPP
eukprot:2977815-Pleurochrysis_carterae.AAC.1